MPAIRFPAAALPLLPLCKGHSSDFIFRTYADLLSFSASYGFHLLRSEGKRLSTKIEFTDTPNPINLEVFENRGVYGNLLMMAIAHDESLKIAEDEDFLAQFIEQLSTLGAAGLADLVRDFENPRRVTSNLTQILEGNQEEDKI